MIKLRTIKGATAMQWNGVDLKIKDGWVEAPDEALIDLLQHGCTVNEEIVVGKRGRPVKDESLLESTEAE